MFYKKKYFSIAWHFYFLIFSKSRLLPRAFFLAQEKQCPKERQFIEKRHLECIEASKNGLNWLMSCALSLF